MVLFYLSFAAGFLAGLTGYLQKMRQSQLSQDTFNAGATGAPSPYPQEYYSNDNNPWFADPSGPVIDPNLLDNIVGEANTWDSSMAYTAYQNEINTTGQWISWNDFVVNMQALGIDWSGFAAPPGGTAPDVVDSWLEDYI